MNCTALQSNVTAPQSPSLFGSRCRVTSHALAYGFKPLALPLAISHNAFGKVDPGVPPPLPKFNATWARFDPRQPYGVRRAVDQDLGPMELRNYKETVVATKFLSSSFLRPASKRLTARWRETPTDSTSRWVRNFLTENTICDNLTQCRK